MKKFFKRKLERNLVSLSVAAACVAGGVGMSNPAMALTDATNLGDLALVPYYTVRNNFITGIHIVNTGPHTQVVKYRMRRAVDSAPALNISIILSPYDVWTGYISGSEADGITVTATDKTCTAPVRSDADRTYAMPDVNKVGAEEGYIEIIAMGQTTDEDQRIAVAAKHDATGVPLSCNEVGNNFFDDTTGAGGVVSNVLTTNFASDHDGTTNVNALGEDESDFEDSDNDLKVSYFIRDPDSGMEFGNNAVHIKDFADEAMMANQEAGRGLPNGFTSGVDFPNLDGGGDNGASRGSYLGVVRPDLAAASILNDWSENDQNGVTTDWVVTIPGEYLMVHPNPTIANGGLDASGVEVNTRDLPLTAAFQVFDREEKESGTRTLIVSPDTGGSSTEFPNEVNVIQWGDASIFESGIPQSITFTNLNTPFGWANLSTTPQTTGGARRIYDLTDQTGATSTLLAAPGATPATGETADPGVPVIGYAAWRRTFTNADKNYGRIVEHSIKE